MNNVIGEISLEQLKKEYNERIKNIRDEISSNLKTQDGRMCGNPMYCVFEKEASARNDEFGVGCKLIREIFFTQVEAELYIENHKVYYKGQFFIYVKSGNHNEGWQYARELMLKDGDS